MGRTKARRNRSTWQQERPQHRDGTKVVGCKSGGGTKKVRYETLDLAVDESNFQWTLYRRKTRVYECPSCHGWHLTRRKLKVA